MQVRHTIGILLLFAILAMLGCSTKNVGSNIPPDRQTSDFSLTVMDDSYFGGASVQDFRLETTDYPNSVIVSVHAEGAVGLKALYFDLEYDAQRYRPMSAHPADALENAEDMIKLSVFKDRGMVHYGQVLTNPDWRTGLTGNSEVATLMFHKEPTPVQRTLSSVSTFDASQSPGSYLDPNLSWFYAWQGDYDQNGETNASDLTPLALNFNEVGPFAENSVEIIVDGDTNGEINIADITPIALNFNNSALGGYNIYYSDDSNDYPASNGGANGAGATLFGNVGLDTATGGYPTDRMMFTVDVSSVAPTPQYFWVRATDGSADGTPSVLIPTDPANLPVLELTNEPAGGDGSMGNPYQADTVTDYVFSLTDPVDGDVTTDPATSYSVSNPAAGTIAGGTSTLNIEDSFTGTFNVTATYDGKPNRPDTTRYFSVGGGPTAEVEIYPDPADTDWAGVTGDGSSADPYVVAVSGGFNDDFSLEFSLAADDDPGTEGPSGNPIAVGDLTWAIEPEFLVDWVSPGVFQANIFTSNFIFAQDGGMNESNHLYVVSQTLPE